MRVTPSKWRVQVKKVISNFHFGLSFSRFLLVGVLVWSKLLLGEEIFNYFWWNVAQEYLNITFLEAGLKNYLAVRVKAFDSTLRLGFIAEFDFKVEARALGIGKADFILTASLYHFS